MATSDANKKNTKKFNETKKLDDYSLKQFIKESKSKISHLSYEQALNELDILLEKMQTSNILVEDLKRSYIKGKLYLEHCEKLLEKVEQEVIEISEEDLN
ncbi:MULTISPECIES: exodeoxyribonuclease VII small subunit [Prochlorococcus]|uniref:exodeoxyribonuclease VII small subunit n=1 Tax=Prochlorococcus TaxID=1218 RepID=UPI000533BBAC|nr:MULTISPECIES: exodeoxyribonuclease VII small subunit [Prochlorococcus]KGG13283.1 Exodeoxyribonuclease VII small subunit [Prochlorococcus sp. MIT 0601]